MTCLDHAAVGLLVLVTANAGACAPALAIGPDVLPDAVVGQAYEQRITVERAKTPVFRMMVVEGTLPPGITLRFDDNGHVDHGTLDGAPTAAGTFAFVVEVGCYGTNFAGQVGREELTIVVRE